MRNQYLGRAVGRRFLIGGVNVFDYKWITTGEFATVYDPENDKIYNFKCYYVNTVNGNVYFVSGQDEKRKHLFFEYEEI